MSATSAPPNISASTASVVLVLKCLWKFVRPYRSKFILGLLLLLVAVPLGQFAIFLTREVTNTALTAVQLSSEERWSIVLRIIGLQFAFWLSSQLISVMREVIEWYTSMKSTFDLRIAFYKHLQRLPMAYLSKRTPGEHLYRATSDMASMFVIGNRLETVTPAGQMPPESKEVKMTYHYSQDVDPFDPGVMGMITRSMPIMVETLYALGWGAALLYLIDPWIALALLVYIVPFYLISSASFKKTQESAHLFKSLTEVETGVLRDSIAGLRMLKAFGRTRHQLSRYYHAAANARSAGVGMVGRLALGQSVYQQGIRWIFTFSLYLYQANKIVQGQATIGDWIATALLIEAAQMPLQNFVLVLQLLRMQAVPASRIAETLSQEQTLADRPNAHRVSHFSGEFAFDDVTFSYDGQLNALEGVSFTIKPGEYVGVVGSSGAGKSSLANLIVRLYAASSGKVKVDGKDILDIELQSYLDQVGVVPQTTYLYSGTIRENILFGDPKATGERLNQAVAMSGLHTYVERHSEGLDTVVEEGTTISGGERQRIGIARALIRNPKLLIMDEATGSLDPATEQVVLETIESLRSGRTILTIAHRMKAVQNCDRILVLDNGKIVQVGTHDQLINTDGPYKNLWQEQEGASRTDKVLQ